MQPICNRCLERGSLLPCHYNKLHHIGLLREHISQLESELSRAKEESSRTPETLESASRHDIQPLSRRSPGSVVYSNTEYSTPPQHVADILGNHRLGCATNRSYFPPDVQKVQLSNSNLSDHLSSTIWLEAEKVPGANIEWVNRTFWEMRVRGRWLAQQGLDVAAIMGDTCPSIYPFSSSGGDDAANFWTVSRWAARFVDSFANISHADRLACWVVIFITFQVRFRSGTSSPHWTGLTACSGRYVPPVRRTKQFQIGTDRFHSNA